MYDRIIAAASAAIWVLEKTKLDAIWAFLDRSQSGVVTDAETIKMMTAAHSARAATRTQSMVGVIPVIGTIAQRVGLMEAASGGVSTEEIGRQFDAMQANQDVGTILFEIDSGGGTYTGVPELANKIHAARGGKRIVSHINSDAGSGALWIASAADEVVITPSGSAGSVGAYMAHVDQSGLNEAMGVRREFVSYGQHKVEGTSDGPLTDETREFLQSEVDRVGQEFEAALGKFRGLSTSKVHSTFGGGRMLNSQAALSVGMVDKIDTFDATVRRVASSKPRGRTRAAIARELDYLV